MTTNAKTTTVPENGETVFIPLNKLKKHPKNARKTPHSEASIQGKAASIAAKGMLQNLVVEPEIADGEPTDFYFVSIGEGRRLAQLPRAKRKEIKKTEPITEGEIQVFERWFADVFDEMFGSLDLPDDLKKLSRYDNEKP